MEDWPQEFPCRNINRDGSAVSSDEPIIVPSEMVTVHAPAWFVLFADDAGKILHTTKRTGRIGIIFERELSISFIFLN